MTKQRKGQDLMVNQHLDTMWQKTGGDRLLDGRSFQEAFDAIPAEVLQRATKPLTDDEKVAVCMDDRNSDDGIYSAGGFILLPDEIAAMQLRQQGIKRVRSHPDCGAGKVLATRQGVDLAQGDAVAIKQSQHLATLAGNDVTYDGPSAVNGDKPHTARAAYVLLDTDMRRSVMGQHVPSGFYLSANRYPDFGTVIEEVLLTPQIAMNPEHAFGVYFTEQSPFYVVLVAQEQHALDQHRTEITSALQTRLPEGMRDKVQEQSVLLKAA